MFPIEMDLTMGPRIASILMVLNELNQCFLERRIGSVKKNILTF